jgi:LPXTG-motif cell wall-anchored protein
MHDATGAGVAGVLVHPAVTGATLLTDVDATTDASGAARWTFAPAPGPATFSLSAEVPSLDPDAHGPTRAPAQRVVRPSRQTLTASASFVTRALTIAKRGDAEPRLAVTGATFRIDGPGVSETVAVAEGGRTPPLLLIPGPYTVTETEPPPGYAAAGPWLVEVADADVTLEVTDLARRGRLRIDKVDAVTGEPVDGATFEVTDDSGVDVPEAALASILPGHYSITETAPPPFYRGTADPVPADIAADQETVIRIPNQPLATIGFEKHPPLPGATFAVRPAPAPAPATAAPATCVTSDDGSCALPPASLDAGGRYCWEETVAPAGWAVAPGGCVELGPAGSVTTIVVDEPPLPAAAPPPAVLPARQPAAPPSPPPPSPPAAPATAPEPPPERSSAAPPPTTLLPVTGAARSSPLTAAGLALVGVGLVLVSRRRPAGSNSSGRPGRRGPRPPPTTATA